MYLASTVHAALAAFILLLPDFPRPFGQLEPFFLLLPPGYLLAAVFILASVLPIAARRAGLTDRWMLYALAPQQFLLIYGAAGGLLTFVQEQDTRALVAMSWSAPLALFHGFDVWELIKHNRDIYGGR